MASIANLSPPGKLILPQKAEKAASLHDESAPKRNNEAENFERFLFEYCFDNDNPHSLELKMSTVSMAFDEVQNSKAEKQDAWLEKRVKQTIFQPVSEKKGNISSGNEKIAKNLISFRDFTKGVRSERKRTIEPNKLKDHIAKLYGVQSNFEVIIENLGPQQPTQGK